MNTYFRFVIIFLIGSFLVHLETYGQVVSKPPYPIIFVHGWAGSDQTWKQENANWVDFLHDNYGWIDGGYVDVCLDNTNLTLYDPISSDVAIKTTSLNAQGDFFFVNFNVKRDEQRYPDVAYKIKILTESAEYFRLHNNNEGDPSFLNEGDILIFGEDEIEEIVRITSIDHINNFYYINRHEFGTTPKFHDIQTITNHSNLSHQASLVKGAKGLKEVITLIKALKQTTKVILACHSMGGLDARSYVQSDYYAGDVALIATYSTPHLGSNTSNLALLGFQLEDYDVRSDAVRDMRYSLSFSIGSSPPEYPYGNDPDDGVALFGGHEDENWSSIFNWYSLDFNGDGISGNPLTFISGLNNSNNSGYIWPSDVKLNCGIGQIYLRNYGGVLTPQTDDDVVRCDRQYPWPNLIPENLLDTFNIRLIDQPIPAHNYTHRQFPEVIRVLDEPEIRSLAYEIPINQPENHYTTGLTTLQSNGAQTDDDFFKFISDKNGLATVDVYEISNPEFWQVSIYNSLLDPPNLTITQITQPGSHAHLEFTVVAGTTYYIGISINETPYSIYLPYQIKVTTREVGSQLSISANSYASSVFLPTTLVAHVTSSNGNSVNNEVVTFTTNNVGYFINGNTATTNLNGNAIIEYIPTAVGDHMISCQLSNNNSAQLSSPISVTTGVQMNKISCYEYWIDHSFSNRISTQIIPSQVIQLDTSFTLVNLTDGLHLFNIHFKDLNGFYSQVMSQFFYYNSNQVNNKKIVSYDYWFDSNINNKSTVYVQPSQTKQIIKQIYTIGLPSGFHSFNIRFKDSKGFYSEIISSYFFLSDLSISQQKQIVEYEYWIDDMYSNKITVPQALTESIFLMDTLIIDQITNGIHLFNIRFKDTKGFYSNTLSSYFYKQFQPNNFSNNIISYRYFFDNEISSMINVELPTPINPLNLITNIQTFNLSPGTHTFNIQFKDAIGLWSSVIYSTFTYVLNTLPLNQTIQNITVNNGQEICYEALQNITVAGNGYFFKVQPGAVVNMVAGQNIIFLPNTIVSPGGYLHGYISTNNQYCSSLTTGTKMTLNEKTLTSTYGIEKPSFKIYPNPTKGTFIIEMFSDNIISPTLVKIYSMMGSEIFTQQIPNLRKEEFNLSDRPPGIYFVYIIKDGVMKVDKIIKL